MPITADKIKNWVLIGLDSQMVEDCKVFAHEKLNFMTTSQIRKFFGEVKRIQADFSGQKESLYMLAPRLAYTCGRQSGKDVKPFYEMFKPILSKLTETEHQTSEKFNRFVKVVECIVAFHKEIAKN